MDLYKSGNPVLSNKTFDGKTLSVSDAGTMTIKGTINKFGFTTLMLLAGAVFSWKAVYDNAAYASGLMWGGLIGGLIIGLVITFKANWSPVLVPAYGVLQGFLLGAVSAMYNFAFAERMPNIITNAVGLTIAAVIAMFCLYKFNIIRATERFKSIIFTAVSAILLFYIGVWIARIFGAEVSFMHDSSPLGIGLSLLIVGVASLSLIVDFDMIERGAAVKAPKYMEWYGAFALMVTIVWLYLEIVKLLSRFASRD